MIRNLDLVKDHYRRNRTIVSRDIEPMLRAIAARCELPLHLHRYTSGADIGTWIVPERWDVREAWIKDRAGRVIASYGEHPLFLVPYGRPYSGTVSKEELRRHTRLHPKRDDCFFYEHRFAYDYRLRLRDSAVTMPRERLEALPDGHYEVHIDLDIGAGEMLVGEIVVPGESPDSIALLADYCHPGQVNDSFSGILAFIGVIDALKRMPRRRFTYRFLLFPETIGSCILLQDRPDYLQSIKLAIFSEFVGWGRNWKVLADMDRPNLAKALAVEASRKFEGLSADRLNAGYGNDEIVFDFAGVPSLSVQMTECDEYHSSFDAPELLEQSNIDRAAAIILRICGVMERNDTYNLSQAVPFYQTRYDLYADAVTEKKLHQANRQILRSLRRGADLLAIANEADCDFDHVADYAGKLVELGLAAKINER